MTKDEFRRYLVERGYTNTLTDAGEIIDIMTAALTEAMVNGEDVCIKGFGTFTRTLRAPKEVLQQNGERVLVPEHYSPRFKPGKVLTQQVREGFIRQ